MTEEEGFIIELALDLGFQMTNDDGDEFACTQDQLLAFFHRIRGSKGIVAATRRVCEAVSEEDVHAMAGDNHEFAAAMTDLGMAWQDYREKVQQHDREEVQRLDRVRAQMP